MKYKDNKKFTDEQLLNMWNMFNELVHQYIKSDRIKLIDKMFEDISEQLTMSPCSTRYHGNYEGGLIEHIIDTIGSVIYVRNYFIKSGINKNIIPSLETCVFVAAFHDLGKIGDVGYDYYIPETSEWHKKTLNRQYQISNKIPKLHHSDGSTYLLSKYNIPLSREEYQAIISHDGAYHAKNRIVDYEHKVEFITRIVREADMLAMILDERRSFTKEELRE